MAQKFGKFKIRIGAVVAMCGTAVFAVLGTSSWANAQERLALIIGNSSYTSIPALKNPKNDANAVGDKLTELGFEVTLLTDAKSEDFWRKLEDFVKRSENAETTLFYYSGHAFQLEGANYLVPVNADLKSREAIFDETWSLDAIIQRLQARNRQTLIFLDACRDSPLPQNISATGGGLARLNTGIGTFVAFATEPGAVTYDGQGENSPFTTALMNHIDTPSISISDMMIRVRNEVEERTYRRQTPWDQSSLRSQFYFQPQFENAPTLTASDYEMLAQLDPKGRERFLALLADSGIDVEAPAELIEGASLELAVADENALIFEPTLASLPQEVPPTTVEVTEAIRPEDVDVVDDAGLIFSVPDAVKTTTTAKAESTVAENVGPVVIQLASLEQAPTNTLNRQTIDTFLPGSAPAATANGSIAIENIEASGPTGAAAIAAASGALSANAAGNAASVASASGALAATAAGNAAALARAGTAIAARAQGDIIVMAALTSATRSLPPMTFEGSTVEGREVLPQDDASRAILASIDPTLLEQLATTPDADGAVAAIPVEPEIDPKELATNVQTELSRLGCYRMRIDGDWGKGSKRALTSYFLNKKLVPDTLEPTLPLLRQMKSESKVVCQVQVARAKPKKSTRPKAAVAKKTTTKKTKAKKAVAKKKTVRKIVRKTSTAKTSTGKKKRINKLSSGVFR